ncbi:FKBP12-interacting protein of 37 kDa [Tanacetum coccineum]
MRDHYFRALDVRRNAIEDSSKAPCQSLLEEKDEKILDLEANDQAINFTSHSKMGKMLMAKCRTLQEESLDFIYMVFYDIDPKKNGGGDEGEMVEGDVE